MAKPSVLALSLLTLVTVAAAGCPAETTRLPPSHELGGSPKDAASKAPAAERSGMAAIVADAAEQAKANADEGDEVDVPDDVDPERAAALAKLQAELAAPAPGDIPAPDDVAAPPAAATKTASGLAYRVLTPGSGTKPRSFDTVEVHYSGWTTDGKMFDSSVKRGKPASFALDRVIKGWTEGVQLMSVGEKTRFWIPAELAYGGQPGRPQGMLVFDVELLKITEGTPPLPAPEAPADVAAPPPSATTTASGLAYRVLSRGTGSEHPSPTARVSVHYTGWTTDGKMFDSSVTRGKPATFPLDRVIAGWTEGVPLMVVGEKTRFWIPESLAYEGKPGKPQGMLVFDVELLSIE